MMKVRRSWIIEINGHGEYYYYYSGAASVSSVSLVIAARDHHDPHCPAGKAVRLRTSPRRASRPRTCVLVPSGPPPDKKRNGNADRGAHSGVSFCATLTKGEVKANEKKPTANRLPHYELSVLVAMQDRSSLAARAVKVGS